jgi:hypothetical protein
MRTPMQCITATISRLDELHVVVEHMKYDPYWFGKAT